MIVAEKDLFSNGTIRIRQDRDGYRFTTDAALLAGCVRPDPRDCILDLGTGCGIVPILLAAKYPDIHVFGIEIQKALSKLARENVASNGLSRRIEIQTGDMKSFCPAEESRRFDRVVSNPPYIAAGAGRLNPNRERAVARHEIAVTLRAVIKTASRCLRSSGEFTIIYPAARLVELLTELRNSGLEPMEITTVHATRKASAKRVIISAAKGGGSRLEIKPPLVVHRRDGSFTCRVESFLKF